MSLYEDRNDLPSDRSFHPVYNFRQHNPAQQLVAVWQNVVMTYELFREGIVSLDRLTEQLDKFIPQVDVLVGMVHKNQGWAGDYPVTIGG